MDAKPRISVVIAAKNEGPNIGDVIRGCQRHVDEVIVVDGHSTDDTRAVAEGLGCRVLSDHDRGKGDAIRTGIQAVTGDIVVFVDADGSHDPDDIPRMIEPIVKGEADHVSGSRLLGGSSEMHGSFDECFRLMGSSFITACINWRFGVRLSESQNGFRAIRTDVARSLGLRENIASIEQEMVIKTVRQGYRMAEIPAHEYRRKHGESHIRLTRVSFRFVYTLVKYLFL
jgi:dolichol-phosphate mannosyltransferase